MKTGLQTASERITPDRGVNAGKRMLMPARGLNPSQAQQVMQQCKLWGSKQKIADNREGINSAKLTLKNWLIEESKDGVEAVIG